MSQSSAPNTITAESMPKSASTSTTSHSRRNTPSRPASTSSHLEQICVDSVRAVNQRDLNYIQGGLYRYISPTFKAHLDNFPHRLTCTEHSKLLRQIIDQFPAHHAVVKSVASDVDEETGIATVFMETEVTGAPPEIRTVTVNEYRWRRDQGMWRCWLHTGMKGVSEYI